MTATTLTTLRQALGQQLDLMHLITNADLDSFAATSVTSTALLQNSGGDPSYYKGWGIFRPGAATAADYFRVATTINLSTGALSHGGANYADTTKGAETVELWHPVIGRPHRRLIDSLNSINVLGAEYVTTLIPLSDLTRHDGGMTDTGTTEYTSVGSPTVAKSTTQGTSYITYGRAALTVANQAATANEGVLSQAMRVNPGEQFNAFAVVGVINAGTAELSLRDNTNSVNFGDSVSTSDWQVQLVTLKNQTVPSTALSISLRLIGSAAGSNIAWNGIWLLKKGEYKVRFPLFVSEAFQVKIMQAVPQFQTAENVYDARSFKFIPLVEGEDYHLVINHEDGEPYAAYFKDDSYFEWPLYLEARVAGSNYRTFAETETATTNVPLHNLLPRWKIDVLETILLGKIPQDKWELYYNFAQKQLIKASKSRPATSVADPKPEWAPMLGA